MDMGHVEDDDRDAPSLHVHDLPQLYTQPSAESLIHALNLLSLLPACFSAASSKPGKAVTVSETGVPRYLTGILSSPLSWISTEELRDSIRELASTRLAERAGRTARPSLTRAFDVADDVTVVLHEPSLTEDRLGLKTWTSSLLLSQRLRSLRQYLPPVNPTGEPLRVLELGAGTGLVGIAAACLWGADVVLTDLPEIMDNLTHNLDQNATLMEAHQGAVRAMALDWSDDDAVPSGGTELFPVILAADPIYSPEHPRWLVDKVCCWLCRSGEARFIVELPLRDGYDKEREDLKQRLGGAHLVLEAEGTETGYDDWQDSTGELAQVSCWWSVWKPGMKWVSSDRLRCAGETS